MAYETILTDKKGKIGFITLDRPDDYNRQNFLMCQEGVAALKEFEQDDEIYVVVINGAGKHFCVGLSVDDFSGRTKLEQLDFLYAYDKFQAAVADYPKATVIAVHGQCMAGGAGLAMRGDITIMEEGAKMGPNAIDVGLSCMKGVRYLERIVGQKKMLELILTGQLWSAQDAERFGLINRIAPKGKLHEVTMEMANLLASKSPTAVRFTKLANSKTRDMGVADATNFLTEHFVLLANTEDGIEGVTAFSERRKPVWKRK